MNKKIYNKDATGQLFKMLFANTVKATDIKSDEKRIAKTIKDDKGKVIERQNFDGFEIKKDGDNSTYFLPSENQHDLPLNIKDKEKLVYRGKVFYIIKDYKRAVFPESDNIDDKEFFDDWMDLDHQCPEDFRVAKWCVLTTWVTKATARVATKKAFGKDGIVESIIKPTGLGRNVNKVSMAKMYQLIGEDFTCFNELSGYTGEKAENMESFFFQTGDGTKSDYEHETIGSHATGSKISVVDYGYVIFHNLPEYYMEKGKMCFEQMFTEAVIDRIFPVLCDGQVKKNNKLDFQANWIDFVKENIQDYKNFIGKLYYLKNHFDEFTLTYDLSRYDLNYSVGEESVRYDNTFKRIATLVERYAKCHSNSDEIFYKEMDNIYKCHKAYMTKAKSLGLIKM